ncbi:hypothetical protein TSAR_013203, partial [Trichomalopsis sarcophagae]
MDPLEDYLNYEANLIDSYANLYYSTIFKNIIESEENFALYNNNKVKILVALKIMDDFPKTLEDVRKMIHTTDNLKQTLQKQEKLLLLNERNQKLIELDEHECILLYQLENIEKKLKEYKTEIQNLNEEKLQLSNKLNNIRKEASYLQTQTKEHRTYRKDDKENKINAYHGCKQKFYNRKCYNYTNNYKYYPYNQNSSFNHTTIFFVYTVQKFSPDDFELRTKMKTKNRTKMKTKNR